MNNTLSVEKVGIADLKLVKTPQLIRTSGLGSCVGVIIYDFERKIAGMAHVMLPESSLAKDNNFNPAKYADTAVEKLVSLLVANGAKATSLKAKMAGGAQMFQFSSANELMRIGPRNVSAVRNELDRFNIHIVSEDVGGNSGRTIEFNPTNGILLIKTVNKGTKEI
ncbi:chemotaxis protein CheD [Neobacillus sp. PS3-40]|jgi:chemotaxis protein CheD|uniref:chemotaxis protein CheD n=1 Tax=Neobacillus sp. PS3-40 TaxID=3070679 RepID=UPI0027E197F4|nr:chemotaxis protein CheD [Neobacillus sp. PS3-40]WML43725.1 chemotaxis protein CheD [Neobacillus sp. PS3-40]